MPGVEEVTDAFGNVEARRPTFIVVSDGWVWRYLVREPAVPVPGRVMPPTQALTAREVDGTTYFRALLAGELGYRLALRSSFASRVWPRVEIHASTSRDVLVFERMAPSDAK
jgi:hypothetical protein